jgi:predicted dienelactone hydrolase
LDALQSARAILVSLCLLVAATAAASEQQVKLAGLDVTVWSDAAVAGQRQPVLLFSHGFRGCATQSRFLMEAFARAGYIVFAPNHRDASCARAGRPDQTGASFRTPDAWTDAAFRDRADDLKRLRDAIAADARFASRADLGRIGLVGHSLGGYTVLGMAGAWPAWKLDGVRAVLALSPYSQPFVVQRTLGGLSAPVMYQGGTRDVGITPAIHKTRGAYEQSPSPKYFVDFEGASHFAWTNLGVVARQSIVDYSVAFADRYVKGTPPAAILSEKRAGVAVFRYATAESGGVTVEGARNEGTARRR